MTPVQWRPISRSMRRLLGVRNVAIGWLFVASLLPGLLAAPLILYIVYRVERAELENSARQTARTLSQAIDSDLGRISDQLIVLASTPSIQTDDIPSFYRQAEKMVESVAPAGAIVLLDATGQQIMNTFRPLGTALPNIGRTETLRQTFETMKPAVSDLFISNFAHHQVVAVQVPVMRERQVVYALNMIIPTEHVEQVLAAQNAPPEWLTEVVDKRGIVAARNRNSAQFAGKGEVSNFFRHIGSDQQGNFAADTLEGTPSFFAYSRTQFSGWNVIVAVPRSVLHTELFAPMMLVTISTIAFTIGGITMIMFFSRYVRRSLQTLGKAAVEAAAGNRDLAVPVTGPREIAQLAKQFNHMQEAQRNAEREVARLAYFDPLTNLPNRRLLSDRIEQALLRADRKRTIVAVCFLDLDNFKPINDTMGHDAGDETLLEIAERLQAMTRSEDTLARLGGDEFVLLLADLNSKDECVEILERVAQTISKPIALRNRQSVCVTVSIGVTFYPGDDPDPDILLRHCDQAMYRAKQNGRNQIHVFDIQERTLEDQRAAGSADALARGASRSVGKS